MDDLEFAETDSASRKAAQGSSPLPLLALVVLLALAAAAFVNRDKLMTGRTAVESSAISSVGYNARGSVLEIEFTSGEVYRYSRVSQQTADALMSSPSKGRYFNSNIKGRYQFEHVQATPPATSERLPLQPTSLDGEWLSSLDETYRITTHDRGIMIKVIQSNQFHTGSGDLRLFANQWSGRFRAVFSKDRKGLPRFGKIVISQIDSNTLDVSSDTVRWDDNGDEIGRDKIRFQMHRQ